jgi:voltage-gated potassium channel
VRNGGLLAQTAAQNYSITEVQIKLLNFAYFSIITTFGDARAGYNKQVSKKNRKTNKQGKKAVDLFDDPKNKFFAFANTILAIVTLVSVTSIALETVASLQKYHLVFKGIEWLSVLLFSAEYITRLFTNRKPLKYVFSFFGIIDLVAILPSILGLSNLTFLKSARTVRIIRLLRMIRLAKFTKTQNTSFASQSVYKINLEIYFLTLTLAVLVLGTLFYTFEHGAAEAKDIPSGMFWSLKAILGGISIHQPETAGGVVTLILAKFTSMILLGMMLGLVGTMVRKMLIGSEKD